MSVEPASNKPADLAASIVEVGRGFYSRGWVLGTSGNFSAVVSNEPVRIAITSSGIDKGLLETNDILEVDAECNVLRGIGKPSAETLLHLAIVKRRAAGAVLHTHSVWSNILSGIHRADGGLEIAGFEMLKGLEGVTTHEHREWLPIIDNSQDMPALASEVDSILAERPDAHGFLILRHGLYTWGKDIAQAKRHVEILEFLLEVIGRQSLQQAG
jgi:methylthioribulose-1-phosphate dehydratase